MFLNVSEHWFINNALWHQHKRVPKRSSISSISSISVKKCNTLLPPPICKACSQTYRSTANNIESVGGTSRTAHFPACIALVARAKNRSAAFSRANKIVIVITISITAASVFVVRPVSCVFYRVLEYYDRSLIDHSNSSCSSGNLRRGHTTLVRSRSTRSLRRLMLKTLITTAV